MRSAPEAEEMFEGDDVEEEEEEFLCFRSMLKPKRFSKWSCEEEEDHQDDELEMGMAETDPGAGAGVGIESGDGTVPGGGDDLEDLVDLQGSSGVFRRVLPHVGQVLATVSLHMVLSEEWRLPSQAWKDS